MLTASAFKQRFAADGDFFQGFQDIYRGKILDVSPVSVIVELTGDVQKLRGFVEIMKNYGILEMAKTGVTAMSRGEKM